MAKSQSGKTSLTANINNNSLAKAFGRYRKHPASHQPILNRRGAVKGLSRDPQPPAPPRLHCGVQE